MSIKIKNNLIKKIAKKLKTTEQNLLKKDDFQNFDTWDSLIHLEILSLIEQAYGNKINKNIFKIKMIKIT